MPWRAHKRGQLLRWRWLPLLCWGTAWLGGCAVLPPKVRPAGWQPVWQGQLAQLDGRYAGLSTDTSHQALSNLLLPGQQQHPRGTQAGPSEVQLTAVDARHLRIGWRDDLGLLAERTCRVRLRGGYGRLPRHWQFHSQFWVINGWSTSQVRLSRLADGTLTVDEAHTAIHFALICPVLFPGWYGSTRQVTFPRLGN